MPTTLPKLYFLDMNSTELILAWQVFDDPEMLNEEYGEVLQYVGTFKENGSFVHQFRHRAHPIDNQRKLYNIAATHGWKPEIEAII
jgi:hypothetical protein